MKPDTWLLILVMLGVGSAALFSMWLAGRLLFYAVTAPTLPPLPEGRRDSAVEANPNQWRAGKRDSRILTIREDAPGSPTVRAGRARQTTGGYIRYVDGSYGAAWRGAASATLLADAEQVNELYRQMTLILNAGKPAGTVLQLRWSNHLTAETGLAAELSANAARAGDERFYAPAQILKADALQELINSAASVGFRAGQLSLWCRVPAKDNGNAGWLRSGPGHHADKLAVATDNPAWGKPKPLPGFKDPLVRRYVQAETEVAAACEKVFAQVQREFPASLQRLNAPRLWQAVYLGHNEQARDTAALPHTAAGYADVRELLCQENWRFGPDYVLHGNTLVGLVSLSMPPQPQTHNGVFRLLTQNPALRFRYTLVVEYLQQDKKRTLRALDKKIWWADKSPKKSPEGRRAESELRQVREDLAAPHLRMVTARVCVLVYGPAVRSQDELQAATAVLDERCEIILSALKQVPGADALREDNTALRVIYPQLLPGALSEQKTGLEIDEVSPACATFAPLEAAWRGHTKPHTLLSNASGELFGLNLFDRAANVGALGVVLGRSGSGKSVFIGKLASDVLACIPEASVVALDFGETYGPLVQALGGRQFRFVPGEEQTINIWDYEGLGEGSPPDDTQIALVVGDLLHLMGLEEGTTEARYKGAVCEEVARAVFNNVAPMNGAGRERREPTLSDFLSLLENFPYEGTELSHAQEINTLLKRYRGHAWLDAPTSAVFQGASRFDVYELDSLELLLADVKSALAYRVAARIISRSKRGGDGRFRPCLQIFDEMHKVAEQYPVILRAILRGPGKAARRTPGHSWRPIPTATSPPCTASPPTPVCASSANRKELTTTSSRTAVSAPPRPRPSATSPISPAAPINSSSPGTPARRCRWKS